ncbi:uncharacterized protein PV09_01098 [Verruconis gallopava]|uniref:Cytochrome c oxidase assembly protein COX16, mitochondrial n=1 Tax=Verruconis gallopava TaxID=253628 RepID=A0A0D1Z5A9_9PEZI|nr:uncharacterized protein PV09_01098 [Verruconis gallopava]KIW08167.1 hypothetical protein PV09_01098 [Verruconis gallopava]
MAVFQSKSFSKELYGSKYRKLVNKYPFWLFGFPFISIMVAGSFFLTPATALRYEKHDNKIKYVSQEEALNVGKNKRKVDMKEEYYRLAAKDLDNWEQKRVERLKGEPDGVL